MCFLQAQYMEGSINEHWFGFSPLANESSGIPLEESGSHGLGIYGRVRVTIYAYQKRSASISLQVLQYRGTRHIQSMNTVATTL